MLNIKDIAKLADVSISTVSRVINKTAYVNPETERRVRKILNETGYTPSLQAREMQQKRTHTIGIIIPRIDLETFSAVFDGISHVLSERKYSVLLADTHVDLEKELEYLDVFCKKRVDGILYFVVGTSETQRRIVSRLPVPVVILDQSGIAFNRPAVRKDSFAGAKDIVTYLCSLGHRRIGCLCADSTDYSSSVLRRHGYEAALTEQGIPSDQELIVAGTFEYSSGYEGTEKLMLRGDAAPTAIFCITDRLAIACCSWLLSHGYRIPQDVSVACVDDTSLLKYCYPGVTTMSLNYELMGNTAARMILECIEENEKERKEIVFPYTLTVRGSTGEVKTDT
ncbi:LacI family DNA-binding transcriptional regulator [Treponema brennaborense]|uniref:Transcriptional regulator, LacI family n=1 Tax=Treponema brennaborense (strain DSM 12168 / CIP 105900 / DD5/3) TaxID=906968 RepID=F4LKR3_TREBD|nr:LacI family DNA-binding transcriptional regulator [Treponema brennaborense]AEE15524.1 transcriptional regulator, LacI family [Treponema brennaborense DSM 12168]